MRPLFLFPLALLVSCGKPEHPAPAASSLPSVTVQMHTAQLTAVPGVEEVVGTVRSRQRSVVEAKISGRILEYTAIPGTTVKLGDVLARLDDQEIQASVSKTKTLLEQSRRELERHRGLVAQGATTRQEFETIEARTRVAEASASEAETMLGYTRVTAPFDGVITRKLAEVGDLAMPGKPLLEMESPGALRFEAELPEAILDRVTSGAQMKVTIASRPEPLTATVSEISPVSDPASRTFPVKFDLPATEGLRTGQFGRVSIPLAESQAILIPPTSLTKRGQMETLSIISDGHARLRLVKSGRTTPQGIEILSGLDVGEQLAIPAPGTVLLDGQPVTIKP